MAKIEWPKFGFLGLLICLVSVLVVAPFLQEYSPNLPVLRLFVTAALLFSIYAFIKEKRALIIASLLAIMGGLIVSTFLTLVVAPTLYAIFFNINCKKQAVKDAIAAQSPA